MNRALILVAAVPALALAALAQDTPQQLDQAKRKLQAELDSAMTQMKVVGVAGAAMGPTVKGAPYSGVEVSETNQVLADGTRIHNENSTKVYRDGEGRVRRETPDQITIMDPVAGASYFLNPKSMTATKSKLAMPMIYRQSVGVGGGGGGRVMAGDFSAGVMGGVVTASSAGENATFEVRTDTKGAVSVTVNGKPADPATVQFDRLQPNITLQTDEFRKVPEDATLEKLKAELQAKQSELAVTASVGGMLRTRVTAPGKTDALGKQMMEGVNADGTRFTTTLDIGAIGNDRPIQIVNERWYSPDLQLTMMTRRSDPRTGEETFRLTNVSRSEPGADLFQVPPSYTLNERK